MMNGIKGKVLIANRGVIARRIARSARELGLDSVVVYSEADADSLHVRDADVAVALEGLTAAETYLDADRILAVARETGATVLHPGYGFLSENAGFAEACEGAGVAFAGPTAAQIRDFGLKHTARELAGVAGLPMLPGTGILRDVAEAETAADRIGYPVMVKASGGGGGIGMLVCETRGEVAAAFESVVRLGRANFGSTDVFLEKFVRRARHVEVQIFGDGCGQVVALGERDCSTQRRNQKVIEEAPAANLPDGVRSRLIDAAVALGRQVGYRSAGTVEFLYDADAEAFYFLEVNTRLQVEHGVTEEVFGVDLVGWMLRLAMGDRSMFGDGLGAPSGVSIQARIYAEMPARNFQPATGTLTHVRFPGDLRVETFVESGSEISALYDPMIAKVIATGCDRGEALARLRAGLDATELRGVETNLEFLRAVLASESFEQAAVTTSFLKGFAFEPSGVDVVDGGIESLIVDWPGRVGFWDVGVPPSGPFDDRSFRAANVVLGNPEGMPGIECTVRGPTLQFHTDTWICFAGAEMAVTIDGEQVERGRPVRVGRGQTLKIGQAMGPGIRGYLCVRGGFDVPETLGSRTTFRLGGFGGHCGRALRAGDLLRISDSGDFVPRGEEVAPPEMGADWEIRVAYGPHGAPDFFTDSDIARFFATTWEVHYNSARTGVRLIGPKPEWARTDGGEAGLHPSNIHDNAYQVGAVDFTGDMPIILGPDGPSLGGFVCPATVLTDELWKVGQLRPGDRVRFSPVEALRGDFSVPKRGLGPAVLSETENGGAKVVIRRQGDSGVLVEFGEMVLDLHLRFRAHALHQALIGEQVPGLLDLTPGIRSLQVRYDGSAISEGRLVELLRELDSRVVAERPDSIASRIVRLPLAWDDSQTRLATEKYVTSVRADAPWCPRNIEFIRRINGLESEEAVREIVFSASYLVMGLGDVYLGAPVATPLDPRHRLVTTKYNPARTWTPENAVGIGGAYLCIYGMEGPGGYQFVGRTVPIWNRFRSTPVFEAGKPWLLRFFDQIQFYPVDEAELMALRQDILTGRFVPEVREVELSLLDYDAFLDREAEGIAAFRERQRAAFAAERERWAAAGQMLVPDEGMDPNGESEELRIPDGCVAISSPTAGSVWKVTVGEGERVEVGGTVAVIESMKMEIGCTALEAGCVVEILVREGQTVAPGQPLMILRI